MIQENPMQDESRRSECVPPVARSMADSAVSAAEAEDCCRTLDCCRASAS